VKNRQGLIHIYTGPGKGKTTAAVGLAVRANAHGMRVCYMSLHKNPKYYKTGEQKNLKKLGISVKCFARDHPLCSVKKGVSHKLLCDDCLEGVKFIRKIFKDEKYDLLIIDEINICVRDRFLEEKDVLELMDLKPKNMELVLTGRGATKKMIKKADLVSFIIEVKHAYNQGIAVRKGIEY